MQDAKPGAVLGRFDSARFTSDGITSTFFRRGNRYYVNTDGEDGALHDFEIRWTFGVYPLQQYLVELSGGRVQALTVAWDARATVQGGQRWFSLTSGHGGPQDPLHWTGRRYNWNYTCSDCHSTAVRKGYNARSNQFRTSFAEVNVACEACHGPGSRHVRWGRYPALLRKTVWRDDGLNARLTERRGVFWSADSRSGIIHRNAPRPTDHEIDMCAQCRARRVHVAKGYTAGANLLDYYIPVIIADMYYPDGQQKGEVYNYGSFLQSRMYAAGVTCSDCHDPHTAKLRMPGNQVCTQCHLATKYDTGELDSSATASLARVATDSTQPWFVRASALRRLAGKTSPIALRAARAQAHDSRPFVRLAALQIAEGFGTAERLELAVPMLSDSTRAVRQGAAWLLAPIVASLRSGDERRAFDAAAADFVASQRYNDDQPGSRLVLGVFFMQRGQLDLAEAEFRAALRLQPQMAQADSGLAAIERARAGASQPAR